MRSKHLEGLDSSCVMGLLLVFPCVNLKYITPLTERIMKTNLELVIMCL